MVYVLLKIKNKSFFTQQGALWKLLVVKEILLEVQRGGSLLYKQLPNLLQVAKVLLTSNLSKLTSTIVKRQ